MAQRVYKSAEVARIMNISARTLYRMLLDGRIEAPMRNPANGYRIWTEHNVRCIQNQLLKSQSLKRKKEAV